MVAGAQGESQTWKDSGASPTGNQQRVSLGLFRWCLSRHASPDQNWRHSSSLWESRHLATLWRRWGNQHEGRSSSATDSPTRSQAIGCAEDTSIWRFQSGHRLGDKENTNTKPPLATDPQIDMSFDRRLFEGKIMSCIQGAKHAGRSSIKGGPESRSKASSLHRDKGRGNHWGRYKTYVEGKTSKWWWNFVCFGK